MKIKNIITKSYLKKLYYNQKLSQLKIAKKLKVSQSLICLYMNKYNITVRSPSEAVSGELNPCYNKQFLGKDNSNWRGGKGKRTDGYIRIYSPKHPQKDSHKYVMEHRLVMERHLGRYLKPEEVVHHENDIKDDNKIENLRLFKNLSAHMKYHRTK